MDDVTDVVFRQLVDDWAPADLYFTEFANADGLQSPGSKAVLQKLRKGESEDKVVAQIWGLQPDNYFKAAQQIAEMGFGGVDINMGCPVRNVIKKGCCSALINNPPLAAELIAATKAGAGDLPVSVKTRIGYNTIQTEEWCGFLLEQDLAALIVHGRTTKEQSSVNCHWEELAKLPALRDDLAPQTVVVGNGDIATREQGQQLAEHHRLDGVMIGRGVFANPYVFAKTANQPLLTKQRRTEMFIQHIRAHQEAWGESKNPAALKKFAKTYLREFDGASDMRAALMNKNSIEDYLLFLNSQLV